MIRVASSYSKPPEALILSLHFKHYKRNQLIQAGGGVIRYTIIKKHS